MNVWNRYWHDFAIHPLRVAALRLAFFGLLAWTSAELRRARAPLWGGRHERGPSSPGWTPCCRCPRPRWRGRPGWWVASAARAALGIAVRQSAVLLALLYGGVYVWCQADSYQHHYHSPPARGARVRPRRRLARPPDAAHRQPSGGRCRCAACHWALRDGLRIQFALVYFWTGFTKIDPVWLTGDTSCTSSPPAPRTRPDQPPGRHARRQPRPHPRLGVMGGDDRRARRHAALPVASALVGGPAHRAVVPRRRRSSASTSSCSPTT
ncbi:MAG: hypothetical protein R3F43_32115 [bacterium]